MKIHLLDSTIYNKISAGEVVENPASVVKELVENSIDAGAKNIKIYIEKGGIKSLTVIDDGCGIEKEYLINAILPHATSKIEKVEDLFFINSLGFRGEALASISSVSDFSIETRYEKDKIGAKLRHFNGETKIEDIAFEKGTAITVKNLFYNTPARFKFLKNEKTEENNITKIVTELILSNPKVGIEYFVDGNIKLNSLGADLFTAISSVYGSEIMKDMLSIDYKNDYITIRGFISNHNLYKSNKNFQTLLVNGRIVTNKTLSDAIQNYYKNILVIRSFPIIVLNIIMPIDKVDVNVHPGKKEVRFENERFVASSLYYAVKTANSDYFDHANMSLFKEFDTNSVQNNTLLKNIEVDKKEENLVDNENKEIKPIIHLINENEDQQKLKDDKAIVKSFIEQQKNNSSKADSKKLTELDYEFNKSLTKNLADKKFVVHTIDEKNDEIKTYQTFIENNDNEIDKKLSQNDKDFIINALAKGTKKETKFKVLGQIFETYLLVSINELFLILDQHAIHERVIYDNLINNYNNNSSQSLMIPEVVDLPKIFDIALIEEFVSLIKGMNIDASLFGENCIKIDAIPLIIVNINIQKFISELWEMYVLDIKNISPEIFKEKLAKIACKNAIKGGDSLSEDKITSFIDYFIENNMPLFCPHGRPTVIKFTKNELEKLFRRVQ